MRSFKLRVGKRLQRKEQTKRCDCKQKLKVYDEKSRDYVPRKKGK